ncbi:MAG: formate/nitrite transporter family protein [Lachnospiraceae bacterium]|nr:formate/nitrite transporter family protein [Lachnospiraceae bacterium]
MFQEEFLAASNAAVKKSELLRKNPAGYFLLSMLAGAFIGFGVLLTNSIGAQLDGAPYTKLVMGLAFGVALSLVVMAGAELFTGNNLVMAAGLIKRKAKFSEALLLWIVCWLGNLCGAILLGAVYVLTTLPDGAVGIFMANAAAAKIAPGPIALLARGALCNMLVCLAVWCGFRIKSDAGKLIMIFWCLFAFITTGFEHSIANMTLFTEVLLHPGEAAVSLSGCLYNLLFVTLGNMIGGIVFVAIPYAVSAKEK